MERRGRPGEGPKVRLSSKREAETRRAREQKAERKAVISPGFRRESTQALTRCPPAALCTAWRRGVGRERALRLGLVARGRFRLGVPESRKRRGKL